MFDLIDACGVGCSIHMHSHLTCIPPLLWIPDSSVRFILQQAFAACHTSIFHVPKDLLPPLIRWAIRLKAATDDMKRMRL